MSFVYLDHQPDLYCVYRFYDFKDHDSKIIVSSNSPNFDDRIDYPVQMDAELDRYLKQSQLTIYVFDDRDQQQDHFVACVNIPLLPMAHDKDIRGTFEMRNDQGNKNGTMDVTLKWKNAYIPPSSATRTQDQRSRSGSVQPRDPLSLLPDESISGHRKLTDKQREAKVRLRARDIVGSDDQQGKKPGQFETTFIIEICISIV
jgi:hypothetical protein